MFWLSLRMLTGNRGKFLGMIAGTAIASLLISLQMSIFLGILLQTANQIYDVHDAQIWVMDPNVKFVDDMKRLPERELYRVKSVPGLEWAVPHLKGHAAIQLPNGDFHKAIILGLDDASLIGAPQEMVMGDLLDLRRPNGVLIDEDGYRQIWPDGPLTINRTIELNNKAAIIVGICRSSPTFQSFPIIYTTYSRAKRYTGLRRKPLSYILVTAKPGVDPEKLADIITRETELTAMTKDAFMTKTVGYFSRNTGVLVNFSLTVTLGFLVGSAISGQMFYLFTVENLRHFGTLKALGVNDRRLTGMIILQALAVGGAGYGVGIGTAALCGEIIMQKSRLAYHMPWSVLVLTAVAVLVIVSASSVISLRRVLIIEPALVYRR